MHINKNIEGEAILNLVQVNKLPPLDFTVSEGYKCPYYGFETVEISNNTREGDEISLSLVF